MRLPLTKRAANEVQGYRINAAVAETEAETDYPEGVPEIIIVIP